MSDAVLRPLPVGDDDGNDPYFTVTSIAAQGDALRVTDETGRPHVLPIARGDGEGVAELRLVRVGEYRYTAEGHFIPLGFLVSTARHLSEMGGQSWSNSRLFAVDRSSRVLIALPTLGFAEPELRAFGATTGIPISVGEYPNEKAFSQTAFFPDDFIVLRGVPRRQSSKLGRQILLVMVAAILLAGLVTLIAVLAT